ncbi:MAG: tetratricopeptide repeat protein [Deltaproteobacteria bacterium]|nr:tetratricopeptide repeat protein [Deltaproteobacteria bacterium]
MNAENDFELNFKCTFPDGRICAGAFVLLFAILLLVYANSFDCAWHYDDSVNILENKNIRINNLSWAEIEKSFYSWSEIKQNLYGPVDSYATWSRPFAYFSFGLNYYFGGLNVFGFHVVNFAIHYLAAVFLFLFIHNMLQLPLLKEKYGSYAYSAALLSAVLWAVHPIQVPAVTYIVQRMASMASLFYIIAMYLYLRGRTAPTVPKAVIFYFLCFTSFLLALGSKQNAAMLPVSLILFDLFFIQGISRGNVIRVIKILGVMTACGLVFVLFYIKSNPSTLDYGVRMFGMGERLLTQPRVFFYYISLLFYPISSRLMLIHSIDISKSLFNPWTTIVSIAALLMLLGTALWKARRMPLISYCVLFFFVNHLIEGSFFSLELVYEHRNYLPSMLFFLPLVIGFLNVLDFFAEKKSMCIVLVTAVTSMMIIWGVTTFMYNDIFKNEMTLWSDNAKKTPKLHGPHHNLGIAYLTAGHLTEAYAECQLALNAPILGNLTNKYKTYITLVQYYIAVGDMEKVLYYANESLKLFPNRADLHNLKGLILMEKKGLDAGEEEIKKAISLRPNDATFHFNLGLVLLKKGQPDKAMSEAQKALRRDQNSWQAYLLISDVFKVKGNLRAADHFQQLGRRLLTEQKRLIGKADML